MKTFGVKNTFLPKYYPRVFILLAIFFVVSLFFSQIHQLQATAAEPDKWISRDEIVYKDKHYFYFGASQFSDEIAKDPELEHFFSDSNKRIYAKGSKSGSTWNKNDAVCSHQGGTPYYGTSVPAGGFLLVSGASSVQQATVTNNRDDTCSVALSGSVSIPNEEASHSLFTLYKKRGQKPYIRNVIAGDEDKFTLNNNYSDGTRDVYIKDGYEASYPCKDAIIFYKTSNAWRIFPIDETSIVESHAPFAKNLVPGLHALTLYGSASGLSAQECRVNPREMVDGFGLKVSGPSGFERKTDHMDETEFDGLENEDCDGFEAQKYTFARYAIDCEKHEHGFGDDHVTITYIDGEDYDYYNPGGNDEDYRAFITMGPHNTWFTADHLGYYDILSPPQTVNLSANQDPPSQVEPPADEDPECEGEECEEGTHCDIEGVGWIVCPILTFMGKLNEEAFGLVAKFLEIDVKLLADNDSYVAWKNFRDLANALFVIAFLIIIYSQITSAGISNYGIKKMMPRLIIAAILVNASYILCQLAVDISNILGASIYQFLSNVSVTSGATASETSGVMSWVQVTTLILAGAAALVAALLLLMTIGTAALLAIAVALLILIARKAAILLLVVVSPVAFVAYLLPNTEDWFRKWWKMFSTLLMVFPVIGLIFGASTLAARILANASDDILLQLTALGIMAVPLFAIPLVLKGAMAATGAIGNKLNGLQDRANSAASGKAKDRYKNSAFARGRDIRKAGKQKYKDERFADAVNNPKSRLQKMRSRAARGVAVTRGGKAGQEHLGTAAFAAANEADNKEVAEMADKLSSGASGYTGDAYAYTDSNGDQQEITGANAALSHQLHTAIKAKDDVAVRAAMTAMRNREGGTDAIQKVISANHDTAAFTGTSDEDKKFRSNFQTHVAANRSVYDAKDGRISQFAESFRGDDITTTKTGRLTQSQLGTQTGDSLDSSADLSRERAEEVLDSPSATEGAKGGTLAALKRKAGR